MFVCPIFAFYFSFKIIFKSDQDKLMYSGLIAVVVANLVIAAYVHMAFNEELEGDSAIEDTKGSERNTQKEVNSLGSLSKNIKKKS